MNGSDLLNFSQRVRNHLYTRLIRSSFATFGQSSVVAAPIRLVKPEGIAIGDGVFVGSQSWIQGGVDGYTDPGAHVLTIGDRVSITGSTVISAAMRVTIGAGVLIGQGTHIADHTHATGGSTPVRDQGITKPSQVNIGEGAWLGQNVVVLPGVSIGPGAVIGANSIVNRDVPAFTLAVGAPIRLVRDVRL